MAPSGDMPDPVSQNESFSLANMVPQNSNNNRNLWEGIESAVRDLTRKEGEVYVVTGSIFQGQNLQRVGGRVLVPTHLFKAIYDARQRKAAAYLVTNAEGNAYQRIAIADLVGVAGIDPFPTLSASMKTAAMELPQPRPHGKGSKKAAEAEPFQERGERDGCSPNNAKVEPNKNGGAFSGLPTDRPRNRPLAATSEIVRKHPLSTGFWTS